MSRHPFDTTAVQRTQHGPATSPVATLGASCGRRQVSQAPRDGARDGASHELWRSLGVALATAVALAVVWLLAREFAALVSNDLWRLGQPSIS